MPATRKKSTLARPARKAPHLAIVPPSTEIAAAPPGQGGAPSSGGKVAVAVAAAAEQEVSLSDGATVRVVGGAAAEIRDREGRLLVRYENGHAEIAAPSGDLRLCAPRGRVVVEAGADIHLAAPGDIGIAAGQSARIEAPRAEIQAADSRITGEDVTVTAGRFFAKVRVLAQQAERLEVSAGRILERAREAYRDVEELLQTRAGRVRAVVEDACHVQARRTSIVSKDDTSIDGRKVLLG